MLVVPVLSTLVCTSEKNDDCVGRVNELDALARAVVKTKLRDALSDWPDITWVSQG